MNKRGVSQTVMVVLMIVAVMGLGFLVFKWMSGSITEGGQKGGDRASAQDVCREGVKIRVNNVERQGDFFIINLENLESRMLSDFIVRYESGMDMEVKKARQVLGRYENANIKVAAPAEFEPSVVKVIPQIILEEPDLKSMEKGWWLCSNQMVVYTI